MGGDGLDQSTPQRKPLKVLCDSDGDAGWVVLASSGWWLRIGRPRTAPPRLSFGIHDQPVQRWQALCMAAKNDLMDWVLEALVELGGTARVVDVSKVVWRRHEHDLRASGDLFYTWQYDIRWAAQKLRDSGKLKSMSGKRSGAWQLS